MWCGVVPLITVPEVSYERLYRRELAEHWKMISNRASCHVVLPITATVPRDSCRLNSLFFSSWFRVWMKIYIYCYCKAIHIYKITKDEKFLCHVCYWCPIFQVSLSLISFLLIKVHFLFLQWNTRASFSNLPHQRGSRK